MCSVDAHEKNNPSDHDYESDSGGYPVPLNSTTVALVSLSATINFIVFWLQGLENSFLERCNMYFGTMKNCFREFQLKLLNQLVIREKTNRYYILLEVVGI